MAQCALASRAHHRVGYSKDADIVRELWNECTFSAYWQFASLAAAAMAPVRLISTSPQATPYSYLA